VVGGPPRYWAKSDEKTGSAHLLCYHLLDVAACANELLDAHPDVAAWFAGSFGLPEREARNLVVGLAGLHDVGKAHPSFQALAPAVATRLGAPFGGAYGIRHDTLAWHAFRAGLGDHLVVRFATAGDTASWASLLTALFPAAAGHHGKPPEPPVSARGAAASWPEGVDGVLAVADAVLDVIGFRGPFKSPCASADAVATASWILAGFVTLADWLGSDDLTFEHVEEERNLADYWAQARARAYQSVRRAGLAANPAHSVEASRIVPGQPSGMQELAMTMVIPDCPVLAVIEDQTGSGKTEAALILASRLITKGYANGLFFGLPTMATADAMHERFVASGVVGRLFAETLAQPATLAIVHGGRKPDDGDDAAATLTSWMRDSRKKALFATTSLATIDQALLGVLPVRHQSLRLFALANRVLVVDEVHSFDAYMLRLLEKLLAHQRRVGGSVILLSATLTRATRARLARAWGADEGPTSIAYPLLTLVAPDAPARILETPAAANPHLGREIRVVLHDEESTLRRALTDAVEAGACGCWIRNTVDDALDAHAALSEFQPTLIHARFALGDRRNHEADIRAWAGKDGAPHERAGKLVVSTQVLEQSLDVDFDVMASDLAPMDLLLQRAGRLQRHKREARITTPVLHVLCPRWSDSPSSDWYSSFFPRGAHVYADHATLWRTMRSLRSRGGRIAVPEDNRSLVEEAYAPDTPPGLRQNDADAVSLSGAKWALAQIAALDLERGYRPQRGKWDEDTDVSTRYEDTANASRDAWLAEEDADGKLRPLAAFDQWDDARLRIPKRLAKPTPELDERAPRVMPDHGVGSTILILKPSGSGWISTGRGPRILYTRERGLEEIRGDRG
jgi:CRISPR-associated endonuclease/helicase Cas3